MYINAVADSVMFYLQHDFYNIIFKIKKIMDTLRVSPRPQGKVLDAHLYVYIIAVSKGSVLIVRKLATANDPVTIHVASL
jgi:hypothetical protein